MLLDFDVQLYCMYSCKVRTTLHVLSVGAPYNSRHRSTVPEREPNYACRVSYLKSRTPTPQASYHTPT